MHKNKYYILWLVIIVFFVSACSKPAPKKTAPAAAVDYSGLVPVPGGMYLQSDGTTTFSSKISGFKLGRYEVTYDLWHKVLKWADANGYSFANRGREGSKGSEGAAPTAAKYKPVTSIAWRDAIVWCNAYSKMSSKRPVYYSDRIFTSEMKDSRDARYETSVNRNPGSCDNPFADWTADGFRLPTEGEWQYAAGALPGKQTAEYDCASGAAADTEDQYLTGLVAWYYSNSDFEAKQAGTKDPNMLGIYDMSGNVFEWCWDWYSRYPSAAADYRGPALGSSRVRRGGSYKTYAYQTSVGSRFSYYPFHGDDETGFRVAQGIDASKITLDK